MVHVEVLIEEVNNKMNYTQSDEDKFKKKFKTLTNFDFPLVILPNSVSERFDEEIGTRNVRNIDSSVDDGFTVLSDNTELAKNIKGDLCYSRLSKLLGGFSLIYYLYLKNKKIFLRIEPPLKESILSKEETIRKNSEDLKKLLDGFIVLEQEMDKIAKEYRFYYRGNSKDGHYYIKLTKQNGTQFESEEMEPINFKKLLGKIISTN
jgi:hypothetical protein